MKVKDVLAQLLEGVSQALTRTGPEEKGKIHDVWYHLCV